MSLLQQIVGEADKQMREQGYVRWPAVAKKFGVSRQRVDQALKLGVERGHLSQEVSSVFRGSLMAARTKSFKISQENLGWLEDQAAYLDCHVDDIVNRLITSYRRTLPNVRPSETSNKEK